MNAILYLLRMGCPWRYQSRDGFPPRSTAYNIFRKFQREGVWEAILGRTAHGLARTDRTRGQPVSCGPRQPIGQIGRKGGGKDAPDAPSTISQAAGIR
jgi:transposase